MADITGTNHVLRTSISRVLYNNKEATRMMFRRKKIWPYVPGQGDDYNVVINGKYYKVNMLTDGTYNLLDGEYLGDFVDKNPADAIYVNLNNDAWSLSTQSRHANMTINTIFMSKSNYNVNSGVAYCKVFWKGVESFTLTYGSYSENNCDYCQVW